ncbi:hypothetical protein CKAH01_10926 [Colletotrichum kahawae]|uniref:Uncharacterized protein n=1 Tax=Colletotrichum kahawae TaxID=34407 RepID=A0AAD9XV09_COLKA|nr:hypothetical protein CKAH01_10926 [Colletotrichum kahawae]
MSLQKKVRGKAGPASLPYDVFLNIVDVLITEAEQCTLVKEWTLYYDFTSPTKLAVWDALPNPYEPPNLQDRFDHIRLPLQINRATRAMVHRKFIRAPFRNRQMPVDAWIRPENDAFVPCFADNLAHYPIDEEEHFRQAMMLPTPQAAALIQSIQRIVTPSSCFWAEYNASSVAALSTLPNLKEVAMDVRRFYPPGRGRDLPGGLISIDYEMFPDLAIWNVTHGAAFNSLFRPLKKKGIRVYGYSGNAERLLIEIVGTKHGVAMKLLPSECSCCKFRVQVQVRG